MESYSEDAIFDFEDFKVDIAAISAIPEIQISLLWEVHEVNFHAELLALDTLLVHKDAWMEIDRWEHEMLVLGVWGPPSSAATVAAATDCGSRVFCWWSPPQERWEMCREHLHTFARVLTHWPACPEVVVQGCKSALQEMEYQAMQLEAVKFYVQTFISQFSRLPTPPIMLP